MCNLQQRACPAFILSSKLVGGIKPCVSTFGADQFDEDDPRDCREKASFFNWFYWSINIGALVRTPCALLEGSGFNMRMWRSIPSNSVKLLVSLMLRAHGCATWGLQSIYCRLAANARNRFPACY